MVRDGRTDGAGGARHGTHALRVLARAGMASPTSPRRALRGLADVRTWGPLVGALRHITRTRPADVGLVDELGEVTYGELDRASDLLAVALRDRGFDDRHTVAVCCRDHRWLVLSLLACGKLGVHVVLVNTGFAAPELADVVEREQVAALIADGESAPLVAGARLRVPCFEAWPAAAAPGTTTLKDLLAEAEQSPEEPVIPRPRRPAGVVLLTSGTTGRPKGARRQVRSALSAAEFLDRIPLRAGEPTFIASPLFHAIGYSQLTVAFGLGSTVVVRSRFDAARLATAVREHGCRAVVLVPTMLRRLLDLDPEFLRANLSGLRAVVVSGSVLAPELARATAQRLGDVLYNLYGSTEAAVAAVATPAELRRAPGTAGRSPHGCAVRLYDGANRRITRSDVLGRIFAGGTLTSAGYTTGAGRPQIGGLVDTGDLGHFDESGLLFVDGRADDMIISGGENVFPAEVENVIATHQAVKDVAVLGISDPEFGQRLHAFVVPIPGAALHPLEVVDFVRQRLARHKVPRQVDLVRAVPRSATGKVQRTALPAG
ncbi:AMP-binding protein [Saccharopolyspora sp. 6V]|uniref:AMP-binding protein n=1 Tax=Saccharopolyspora sp. 6V TaxID=2877239 RepID=UPI001CD504CD|nr:AMP-binding protein [Saccharopolyspora sp. 6V]MCA1192198.1 AMP-binding protein [Saccharopolyspora sp. 6V]